MQSQWKLAHCDPIQLQEVAVVERLDLAATLGSFDRGTARHGLAPSGLSRPVVHGTNEKPPPIRWRSDVCILGRLRRSGNSATEGPPMALFPESLDEIDFWDLDMFLEGDPHLAWSLLRREAPMWLH